MDMYPRECKPLKSQSFFLFGARGTGKTTFLHAYLGQEKILWIDLLSPNDEERFFQTPELLEDLVIQKPQYDWVVIDEIQKLPKLLDVIHRLIENKNVQTKFALTGSSARKLKRGAANLLAGRAFANHFFPFTFTELGNDFELQKALEWGLMPHLWQLGTPEECKAYLKSYVDVYLKEEVWSEQLIKNLPPFRKFLEVASQMNSEIVNYTKISKQVMCDVKTVQSYFSILEDTLLGFQLEAYHSSVRKRLISSPKFYFFDYGVKRTLDRSIHGPLVENSYGFGKAFEHFIITQFHYSNSYQRSDFRFYYLKTKEGAEIDLIIDRPGKPIILMEIKSTRKISDSDLKILYQFKDDFDSCECYCLSLDPINRNKDGIDILHWESGIKKIMAL